jgi:hypothetical protein
MALSRNASRALYIAWALAFALALPFLLDFVEALGHRIPQADRGSDYLKGVAFAGFFWLLLFLFPVRAPEKRRLLILWGVKAAVTLGLMLFYEWNYGLDAYWYFQRSQMVTPDFSRTGWGAGTENLVALLWWLEHEVVRTASYHSLKVMSSFVGLLGIYLFYRGLARYSEQVKPGALLYIGLFPSILFWSSILGKDTFNLFGIGLAFYSVLCFFRTRRLWYLVTLGAALLLLSFVRIWMVPLLIVPFAIGSALSVRNVFLRGLVIALLGVACLYSLRYLGKPIALENTEALTDQMNRVSRSWQRGGSAGDLPELNSMSSVLLFLPFGMFTALFRPLPWDVPNIFGFLSSLENVFLVYLLWQSLRAQNRQRWRHPVAIWFAAFVLSWAGLYAFISPQNLGSAVRFKLQVLPALLVLLTYTSNFLRLPGDDSENSTDSKRANAHPRAY